VGTGKTLNEKELQTGVENSLRVKGLWGGKGGRQEADGKHKLADEVKNRTDGIIGAGGEKPL